MPNTYEQPPPELRALIDEARDQFHPVLSDCEVSVAALLIADIDEESGMVLPALKVGGYGAAACIKATSLKERALGLADAILIVDRHWWESHKSTEERLALVDHELTHLQVKAERGVVTMDPETGEMLGSAKVDDCGRPVLRMRKHDFQLGGFLDVARRHKDRAVEVQEVKRLQHGGQWAWDFEGDGVDEVTISAPTLGRSVTLTREHGDALRAAANATSPPPAE